MPGVPEPGGAHPSIPALTAHQELANQQAAKLLDMFTTAKPMNPDAFVPAYGVPGGADVPEPHGLFTYALIGPDVWPTESESELGQLADQLGQLARNHETAADSAQAQADAVFSGSWTAGEGSDAAYEHYQSQYGKQLRLADALRDGAGGVGRLGEDIRRTKRLMREAHDDAHRDIEAFLKSNSGMATAQIAVIIAPYRTLINGYATELRGHVADETTMLTNKFGIPDAPPALGGGAKEAGFGKDAPTDKPPEDGPKGDQTGLGTGSGTGTGLGRGRPTGPGSGEIPSTGEGAGTNGLGRDASTPSIVPSPPVSSPPRLPTPPSMPSARVGSSFHRC